MSGDSDFDENAEENATHIPAMILVGETDVETSIKELESQGITVLYHRDNILLTYVPIELAEEGENNENDDETGNNEDGDEIGDNEDGEGIEDNDDGEGKVDDNEVDSSIEESDGEEVLARLKSRGKIKRIIYSKPRRNTPLMKEARYFNNAFLIEEGKDLPQPFDGKGVVVGVCDLGLDVRHPNFLSSDGKECRIRKVVEYKELFGERVEYNTPEDIYEWHTDTRDDWHATHVTGIAAGSHRESGYYSLAPESDIVFSSSMLSDVGLLAGVEDIISYAKEVGKPAVINLSMGNYVGPHDGSSLFTQYLDKCADDAIICLSIGNEGEGARPRSASFEFSESNPEYRFATCNYSGKDVAGEYDIWSRDETPFSFAFYLNSTSGGAYRKDLFEYSEIPADGITEWRMSVDPEDTDFNELLAQYYKSGYIRFKGGISPLNGHFFLNVEFDLQTEISHFTGDKEEAWAEFWPAIKLKGEEGCRIDAFVGGDIFFHQERGFPKPDNAICASDLATGFRTISVGMMNNTDVIDNPREGDGMGKGEVSLYSSYGTLPDGRIVPTTCAPGAYMTSSISSPFLEEHPEELQYIDDSSEYNGETVYWIATLGTSMSCPYVVSAIATWLQAYPKLTSEEAIDIIIKTNQTTGYPDPENPRHGMGWLNPYSGLQEVVGLAALKVGTVEAPLITLKIEGNELIIGNPSGDKVYIDVYNTAGCLINKKELKGTLMNLSLAELPQGVHIVKVTDLNGNSNTLKFVR